MSLIKCEGIARGIKMVELPQLFHDWISLSDRLRTS